MIKVRVKTLWQGQVGVRDKYLKEADQKKEDLVIVVDEETMTISSAELRSRIKAKSDRPFKDRFSNQSHWLYYYDWKPDNPKLF